MRMKKSYFLGGLGLGIMISSFLSFVIMISYQNQGSKTLPAINKEEIIRQAEDLGMIFITELPSATKDWTEEEIIVKARELGMDFVVDDIQENEIQNNKTNENNEAESSQQLSDKEAVEDLKSTNIYIPPGSSAIAIGKLLAQEGIIANAEIFYSFIMEEKATTKLRAGNFEIPIGSTNEEILLILQRKEKKD